jgi:hypothetical protein
VPEEPEEESDSGYSTPSSAEATGTRRSRSTRQEREGGGDHSAALVVRQQQLHVRRQPGAHQRSQYSDDDDDGYEEYTVGGDGRGARRQRYREKDDRGLGREGGLLLVIAAFMVGLVFCLRETRRRDRR